MLSVSPPKLGPARESWGQLPERLATQIEVAGLEDEPDVSVDELFGGFINDISEFVVDALFPESICHTEGAANFYLMPRSSHRKHQA